MMQPSVGTRRLVVVLLVLATGACTPGAAATHGRAAGDEASGPLAVGIDLPFSAHAPDESLDTWHAMNLYLDQVGRRAGPYPVELVRYDNAPPPHANWDETECVRNANAHIANRQEVAVIGTRSSVCAKAQVPILNRAPGGPMLMVSHTDANPGLTKVWEPNEPARYAADGRRSFARVVPPDDLQGTAAARFAAEDLGLRTCFVLIDGETYGAGVAKAFAAEAGRRGIRIVGPARWRREANDYRVLLRRAEAAGADCVFLGGLYDNNGGQLIRDKVAVLGDNGAVKLLAPDGFAGYPDLLRARAANGMYITRAGLPVASVAALPGVPARFLADFRARYNRDPDSARVLYGVLALQVVLAAIARSDGSRVGVRNQIFEGDGLGLAADVTVLGRPVTIDPQTGDSRPHDVTILQIKDGTEVSVAAQTV
jgi:branched-chain amino acid transport system substrate-binding protein